MLTPDPLKREAPQMFKPTQYKTTITPNTFTAQDAGIYSNAELGSILEQSIIRKTLRYNSPTTWKIIKLWFHYST